MSESQSPAAAEVLLEARQLVAGYVPEADILKGCDLQLRASQIVGVIGANGAGKSTLIKALFGLLPVRSGSVYLDGEDITGLRAHEMVARGVGYVPQTDNVFPRLTVGENLEIGAYRSPGEFDRRFEEVAELFPLLAKRTKQRAGSLSGGERQMLAMARALMMNPRILCLDEPSAGLSPVAQNQVFARVRQINEAGVSVIMVEQNARRCLQISHRAYVLDDGQNAYTGTGKELLEDPRVVELYLGSLLKAH
ncbi:MAG: ABC transporter ATP-binding protein [Actinomycetota bacterium]